MSLLRSALASLAATAATVLIFTLALGTSGCGRQDEPAPRPAFRSETWSIGTSMLPAFAIVERIGLEHCRYKDLKPGDTVIYWHAETRQYIHHRLVERDDRTNRWRTRGDSNPGRDTGIMTADEFEGRTHKL